MDCWRPEQLVYLDSSPSLEELGSLSHSGDYDIEIQTIIIVRDAITRADQNSYGERHE